MRVMDDREEKFKNILVTYRSRIYRLCCSYVKNDEDRQDLFHDILIRIWRGLDSFQNRSSISTWIYRISVNSCIDFKRGEKRARNPIKKIPVEELESYGDLTNTEESFFCSEQIKFLYRCIGQLSFVDRTIISLYLDDLSYKEIAEIVGISENHVGVKIHRIKRVINKQLEGFGQ